MARHDFTGMTAIVTGAASGIGLATARRLLDEGANVTMVDVEVAALEHAVGDMASPDRALPIACDIRDADAVDAMVNRTVDHFGQLDAAFNNAGIAGPHRKTHEFSRDEYAQIMDTNVLGTWLCMRSEITAMLPRGTGMIVNTASAIGLVGGPNQSIYSASKHAIVGLTRSAALDLGPTGIRVNCVCPGVVATPLVEEAVERDNPEILQIWRGLHPVGRIGYPDEVAALVAWLFSEEAAFMHGAAISIDGGYVTS